LATGCDQGHQDDQPITVGPAIELVSGPGSLTNIGGNQAHPADQPIVLQFNRLLNPSSVTRQSIQLLSSSLELLTDPLVDYDPVLMTVTLSNPGKGSPWLVDGHSYEISLPVPTNPNDIFGLQAIDGATFASPVSVAFAVGAATDAGSAPQLPTMHFCVDILPTFIANCSSSGQCHSSSSVNADGGGPAAGLVLDNSEGVALTAIGRVAHGSNTGASAGTSSPGTIFGIDMPIIDPGTNGSGDPADSWLLYKVLLAVPSTPDGGSSFQCNPFQTAEDYGRGLSSPAAMTDERAILSNVILGREMPYPTVPNYTESDAGPNTTNLSVPELERLRLWIKQGAPLETVTVPGPAGGTTSAGTNCSMCAQIPLDAGTATEADASTDASMDAPGDGPSDAGTKG